MKATHMKKLTLEEAERFEALDREIERLENKLFKKRDECNKITEELEVLLEERHPERKTDRIKDALYEAYLDSRRSLDEILDLIRNADEWI